MFKRLMVVLTALVSVAFFAPATAQAATCSPSLSRACVFNDDTTVSLRVGEDWCGTDSDANLCDWSRTTWISAKTWSPYTDTDGWYLPSGYNAIVTRSDGTSGIATTTGWQKVTNARSYRVNLYRE